MGEAIKKTSNEAVRRWKEKMPKFFRWIMYICALIGGTALAVNTAILAAGATPHDWWVDIFPYLIGVPAGAAFVSRFTVDGGYRDKQIERHNTILDKDDN
jgi:hypothetical protein